MEENVLVIEKDRIGAIYGASAQHVIEAEEEALLAFVDAHGQFMPRNRAETDFDKKQIISYCMIVCENHIFVTHRSKKQTEQRLHNMYSVGVGGHICTDDLGGAGIMEQGMLRELHEEVHISEHAPRRFYGLINDDSTEVGRVHAGVCYVIEAEDFACSVKETDKMTGEWVAVSNMREYYEQMEGWSQIFLASYLNVPASR